MLTKRHQIKVSTNTKKIRTKARVVRNSVLLPPQDYFSQGQWWLEEVRGPRRSTGWAWSCSLC